MAFSIPLIEEYRPVVTQFLEIVTEAEALGGGVFLMRYIPFDTADDENSYRDLVTTFDHIWAKRDEIKNITSRDGVCDREKEFKRIQIKSLRGCKKERERNSEGDVFTDCILTYLPLTECILSNSQKNRISLFLQKCASSRYVKCTLTSAYFLSS